MIHPHSAMNHLDHSRPKWTSFSFSGDPLGFPGEAGGGLGGGREAPGSAEADGAAAERGTWDFPRTLESFFFPIYNALQTIIRKLSLQHTD